ncbi:MAG: shikimate dehydrogenase [Anaerolineales bacterium]|nr:shikimate dehydrogenase [Anaerolineales bacterium]
MIRLGLIGYPLGHSLSPKIQVAALDVCGLEGEYALFPIAPGDQQGLKELLAHVRSGEITGLNVTIPHKQNVVPMLDELRPTAHAIGAVNTISMQNGRLIGDNTDAPGFLADLKSFLTTETQRHRDKKSVLVLGAGGSARAVVYALVNDGWNVTVTARQNKQSEELAIHYELHTMHYPNLQPTTFNLIVNTTPLGMSPNVDESPWPADLPFPPDAAVYDLIYNPRETKLVKDARAAGLPATTGLGMLIEQAALAFEIWTGYTLPRKNLWNAVKG